MFAYASAVFSRGMWRWRDSVIVMGCDGVIGRLLSPNLLAARRGRRRKSVSLSAAVPRNCEVAPSDRRYGFPILECVLHRQEICIFAVFRVFLDGSACPRKPVEACQTDSSPPVHSPVATERRRVCATGKVARFRRASVDHARLHQPNRNVAAAYSPESSRGSARAHP